MAQHRITWTTTVTEYYVAYVDTAELARLIGCGPTEVMGCLADHELGAMVDTLAKKEDDIPQNVSTFRDDIQIWTDPAAG
jgi:hypothetical protein